MLHGPVHRLPLRWRLVVAALVGAVCFAVGFGLFATWQIDHLEDRSLSTALRARLDLVREELRPDGLLSVDVPSPRTSLVQVIGPDGTIRDATPTLAGQPPFVQLATVRGAGSHGVQRDVQLPHSHLTVLAVPVHLTASGVGPAGVGAVVVGLESEGFLAAGDQLRVILVIGLGVIVPLAGVLAWVLAGRALRTVTRLTEEAEAVGVSDLGRGLDVPASDSELGRLVAALNRMLDRVAAGLEKERRFAADASHRLRTPLATLRAEAELALADPDPAGQREALRQVIADADNLTDLVNRLLAAHRRPTAELRSVPVALGEAAERWRRQAGAAGVAFTVEYAEAERAASPAVATPAQQVVAVGARGAEAGVARTPGPESAAAAGAGGAGGDATDVAGPVADAATPAAPAYLTDGQVDPHVLRSVIDPLVENALQHTPTGGAVAVRVGGDRERLVADVRDTGHGVSPEIADRLFRPWTTTRGDRGGAGLGLWLARESARAAGGDVVLLDGAPGRTTFEAVLPLE